jgi:hypothetical protein
MKLITFVILLITLISATVAFGADWKKLDDGLYIDRNSIKMKGNGVYNATIKLGEFKNIILKVRADCRINTLYIEGIGTEHINSRAGLKDRLIYYELCVYQFYQ